MIINPLQIRILKANYLTFNVDLPYTVPFCLSSVSLNACKTRFGQEVSPAI